MRKVQTSRDSKKSYVSEHCQQGRGELPGESELQAAPAALWSVFTLSLLPPNLEAENAVVWGWWCPHDCPRQRQRPHLQCRWLVVIPIQLEDELWTHRLRTQRGKKNLCVLELMEYVSQPQQTSSVPWVSHWEKRKGIPADLWHTAKQFISMEFNSSAYRDSVIWPHLSLQTYWLSLHTLHSVHQLLSAASSLQNSPSHLTFLRLSPCHSACSTVPPVFCGLTYSYVPNSGELLPLWLRLVYMPILCAPTVPRAAQQPARR